MRKCVNMFKSPGNEFLKCIFSIACYCMYVESCIYVYEYRICFDASTSIAYINGSVVGTYINGSLVGTYINSSLVAVGTYINISSIAHTSIFQYLF